MAPLSASPPPNYSFYALAIYYILTLLPQFYGILLIKSANNGNYNNANPRGSAHQASLRKSVDKKTVALYERAGAAHNNSFENFTLFATAVICANVARVDADTLNLASAAFLAWRVAYVVAYLTIEKGPLSFLRTALWAGGTCCCLYLLGTAGGIMANGGPTS